MSTPSKYHKNVSLRKKRQDIRKHLSDPEQKRGSKEQHLTRRRKTESGEKWYVCKRHEPLFVRLVYEEKPPCERRRSGNV